MIHLHQYELEPMEYFKSPINQVDIGIQKAFALYLPAFLSSLHSVHDLVSQILSFMDNQVHVQSGKGSQVIQVKRKFRNIGTKC